MKNLIKLMLSLGVTVTSTQSLISCSVTEFDNTYNSQPNTVPNVENPKDGELPTTIDKPTNPNPDIDPNVIPENKDSLIVKTELLSKVSNQVIKLKKFDYNTDQKIVTNELRDALSTIDNQINTGFDETSENYQKIFTNGILSNSTVYDLYLTDQTTSKIVHLQVNLEIYSAADVIDENVLKFIFSTKQKSSVMSDGNINKFGWEKYLNQVYQNWYYPQTSHVLDMREDHVTEDMVVDLNVAWKKFLTEAFFTRVNEDLYYKELGIAVKQVDYQSANNQPLTKTEVDWSTMKTARMNLHNYSVTQLLDSVKVDKSDLINQDGTILGSFTFFCSNGYAFDDFFLRLSDTKTKMISPLNFTYKMDVAIEWIKDTVAPDWELVYSSFSVGDYHSYFTPILVSF